MILRLKRIDINLLTLLLFFLIYPQIAFGVSPPNITYLGKITFGLRSPIRIASDSSGLIYVTDSGLKRVSIFDTTGTFVDSITGLLSPLGIAVDKQGRVYVGDDARNTVSVYESNGTFLYNLGKKISMPSDIAISPGGSIYVVDSKANCVNVFNPDGSFAFSFGSLGIGNGEFYFPTGIFINPDSTVYVGELGEPIGMLGDLNSRIQKFDLSGNYLGQFGEYGNGGGKFRRIQGFCMDDSDRVYVSDAFQSIVQCVDTLSDSLAFIGDYGSADGLLKTPLDCIIDKYSRLWITSPDNGRIEVYGIDNYGGPPIGIKEPNYQLPISNFQLFQNYPNPFSKKTVIRYSLIENSKNSRFTPYSLMIYDVSGRLVKRFTINDSRFTEVVWDGSDEKGKPLPSGIYFYRLNVGGIESSKKAMFLR